ncbi:MAG: FAD binding domain-containing protein [Geminicoccaceae bacterium]
MIDLGGIAEPGDQGGGRRDHHRRHDPACRRRGVELVQRVIPALAALAEGIDDPQVRHRGTLGGSISPAMIRPPTIPVPCSAWVPTVRTSKREIAGDDFFTGMFETALEPRTRS